MGLAKRIVAGTICGLTAGLAYTVCHWGLAGWISTGSIVPIIGHNVGLFFKSFLMRGVFFSTAAVIGAVIAETSGFKPDPPVKP